MGWDLRQFEGEVVFGDGRIFHRHDAARIRSRPDYHIARGPLKQFGKGRQCSDGGVGGPQVAVRSAAEQQ